MSKNWTKYGGPIWKSSPILRLLKSGERVGWTAQAFHKSNPEQLLVFKSGDRVRWTIRFHNLWHIYIYTYKRKSQLLDQHGPGGQVEENCNSATFFCTVYRFVMTQDLVSSGRCEIQSTRLIWSGRWSERASCFTKVDICSDSTWHVTLLG